MTGFTLTVQVQAALSPSGPSAGSCLVVFDPTRTRDGTDKDVSHVDLGFYLNHFPTPTQTSAPTQTLAPTPHPVLDIGIGAARPGGVAWIPASLGGAAGTVVATARGAVEPSEWARAAGQGP